MPAVRGSVCAEEAPLRRELAVERAIDAERETVFRAWIEPARLARWWGPRGFTNPVCEIDARDCGSMRVEMRGPDGTVYPMAGVFGEIVANEKLIFLTAALNDDGHPLFEMENTATFSAHRGGTILRLVSRLVSWWPEAPPNLDAMQEGWEQSLDRLEADLRRGR